MSEEDRCAIIAKIVDDAEKNSGSGNNYTEAWKVCRQALRDIKIVANHQSKK